MKEYLTELVRSAPTPLQGRQRAREYLQGRILGILQRAGAMVPLAFHGGTALRFLYGSARYSEDLDFGLERLSPQYDFRSYLRTVQRTSGASQRPCLMGRPSRQTDLSWTELIHRDSEGHSAHPWLPRAT